MELFSHKWAGGYLENKIAQKSVFQKVSKRHYGLAEYTCFSTSKGAPCSLQCNILELAVPVGLR